jgi:hypothetical protein
VFWLIALLLPKACRWPAPFVISMCSSHYPCAPHLLLHRRQAPNAKLVADLPLTADNIDVLVVHPSPTQTRFYEGDKIGMSAVNFFREQIH